MSDLAWPLLAAYVLLLLLIRARAVALTPRLMWVLMAILLVAAWLER